MKKALILLVGRTGVGKDTVASLLPFEKIVSYTTRKKGDKETDGVEHWFVSEEEMDCIEKRDDIIAWTKIGDVRYCADLHHAKGDTLIYVVDPNGVDYLLKNKPDLNIVIFGLTLSKATQLERLKNRNRDADFELIEKRLSDENEQFDRFFNDFKYDYCINNISSFDTAMAIIRVIDGLKLSKFHIQGCIK